MANILGCTAISRINSMQAYILANPVELHYYSGQISEDGRAKSPDYRLQQTGRDSGTMKATLTIATFELATIARLVVDDAGVDEQDVTGDCSTAPCL